MPARSILQTPLRWPVPYVLGLAWLLALSNAGCGVDRRSDALRCEIQSDCPADRTCDSGWCVAAPDQPNCPGSCSRCEGDVCIIECAQPQDCRSLVQCPAGMPCEVLCTGRESCTRGVNCQDASACTIVCEGELSCVDDLVCGAGPCQITCSGPQSCADPIDCSASCACTTSCTGSGACEEVITCPSGCAMGGQCQTSSPQCNRC